MANGSLHSLGQVAESAYGVTPATPAFASIRHTSTSLALSKNTFESNELRSDRNIADFRIGAGSVGGDIASELSFGSFDAQLEALLCGEWVENALVNGIRRRSFSILRRFGDLTAEAKPYHLFTGCEYNTLALQVTTDAVVKATFGVIGKNLQTLAAAPEGATFPAASAAAPMDSFGGRVMADGKALSVVTEIQLNVDNGITPRFVVGSKESIPPSVGRCRVSGQITAYFEDSAPLDAFINEESAALVFTLNDATGNALKCTLPRVKYTGGQPNVTGEGPITLTLPFQALLDEATGGALKIERIPA